MAKRDSMLIATWTKDQDPMVDLPSSATHADGTAVPIDDYQRHLGDTFSWNVESPGEPRRIIQPSLVATVQFDRIAEADSPSPVDFPTPVSCRRFHLKHILRSWRQKYPGC